MNSLVSAGLTYRRVSTWFMTANTTNPDAVSETDSRYRVRVFLLSPYRGYATLATCISGVSRSQCKFQARVAGQERKKEGAGKPAPSFAIEINLTAMKRQQRHHHRRHIFHLNFQDLRIHPLRTVLSSEGVLSLERE